MKKFILASLLLLASCATDSSTSIDTGSSTDSKTCANVRGVIDPDNGGKIYYAKGHRLYSFIKLDTKFGDKNFCSIESARKAGFKEAPQYFKDSLYYLTQCLNSESEGGSCHTYIDGIYQSLKIYNKVCSANPGKKALANTVESYSRSAKNGIDLGKYIGTTKSFLNRYGCR